MLCCCDHDSRRSRRRDSETIQHTLFECKAFVEDRNESLKRLYVIHPAARGLSDEGHCRLIKLPTIGWNPAGLVESGPSYTSYISAAIYFVRGRHLAWCPTNVKMQLEWN